MVEMTLVLSFFPLNLDKIENNTQKEMIEKIMVSLVACASNFIF